MVDSLFTLALELSLINLRATIILWEFKKILNNHLEIDLLVIMLHYVKVECSLFCEYLNK